MKRFTGWGVGAVVGIVVGIAVALSVHGWQESREASDVERRADAFVREDVVPAPVDAIRALLAQDSRVVVDPLLEGQIPEQDRQRAEEILADSPVPARIAYLSHPDNTDAGYTTTGAGPQWWTGVGEKGHYVVLWDNGTTAVGAVGLEPDHLMDRTAGQPGPALERIAAEMATWEAVPLPTEPDEPGDFDYWSGVGGGLAAALLFGALGVVPVFLLLRWYVGTRRRKVA